jgi:hypothetical protein
VWYLVGRLALVESVEWPLIGRSQALFGRTRLARESAIFTRCQAGLGYILVWIFEI